MPLYLYECPECHERAEAFNRVASRHTHAPVCGKNATHGPMGIRLTPNMGYVQGECHYICPMTRREVTSHRQRLNIMREKNVVDANDLKPAQGFAKAKKEQARDRQLMRDLKKDLTTGAERPMSEQQLNTLIPAMEHV